jgi:hypothetical protein
MTTIPHQPELSSDTAPEPEDRRVNWLFAFLFLNIAVIPTVTWAAAVMLDAGPIDPLNPDAFSAAFRALVATLILATFGVLTVLFSPRLADWFGVPNWNRAGDERSQAVFNKAATVSLLATNLVMLIVAAIVSTIAWAFSDTVAATILAVLVVSQATFYLTYLVLNRRT